LQLNVGVDPLNQARFLPRSTDPNMVAHFRWSPNFSHNALHYAETISQSQHFTKR
jgi:hypothetical protein